MVKLILEGINADIDTGAAEEVCPGGNTHNVPAAAAVVNVISSSTDDDGSPAGTGARTCRVYGLDASFNPIQEDFTLNGTSSVTGLKSFLRVNYVEILTVGSGGANAGTVDARHSTTILAQVPIGKNISKCAAFSAPIAPRRWALKKFYGAVTNGVSGAVAFELWTRKQDGAFISRCTRSAHGANISSFEHIFEAPIMLDPGEDVKIIGTASADNSAVAAGIELLGMSNLDL